MPNILVAATHALNNPGHTLNARYDGGVNAYCYDCDETFPLKLAVEEVPPPMRDLDDRDTVEPSGDPNLPARTPRKLYLPSSDTLVVAFAGGSIGGVMFALLEYWWTR